MDDYCCKIRAAIRTRSTESILAICKTVPLELWDNGCSHNSSSRPFDDPVLEADQCPVAVAAAFQAQDLIKILVEHKADVNKGTPNALRAAIMAESTDEMSYWRRDSSESSEMLHLLLKLGSKASTRDIALAVRCGFSAPDIERCLLAWRREDDEEEDRTWQKRCFMECINDHGCSVIGVVPPLLHRFGMRMGSKVDDEYMLLHILRSYNNFALDLWFEDMNIAKGTDIPEGAEALRIAISTENPEAVPLLIKSGIGLPKRLTPYTCNHVWKWLDTCYEKKRSPGVLTLRELRDLLPREILRYMVNTSGSSDFTLLEFALKHTMASAEFLYELMRCGANWTRSTSDLCRKNKQTQTLRRALAKFGRLTFLCGMSARMRFSVIGRVSRKSSMFDFRVFGLVFSLADAEFSKLWLSKSIARKRKREDTVFE